VLPYAQYYADMHGVTYSMAAVCVTIVSSCTAYSTKYVTTCSSMLYALPLCFHLAIILAVSCILHSTVAVVCSLQYL
jgi:hypothetical protein